MNHDQCAQRVVALVLSRERRARVIAGVGPAATVCFCCQRDELAALAAHPNTVVVITEARDSNQAPVAPIVARLTTGRSCLPVIAYVTWPGTPPNDIVDV